MHSLLPECDARTRNVKTRGRQGTERRAKKVGAGADKDADVCDCDRGKREPAKKEEESDAAM